MKTPLHLPAVVVGALLLLSAAPAAQGQEPPAPSGAAPARGACHADVQRFCAAERGKPGGVRDCLREHRDELTEDCRAQIQQRRGQRRQRGAAVRAACSREIERFCSTDPDEKLGRCLRSHESLLSKPCREALPGPRRGGKAASGAAP